MSQSEPETAYVLKMYPRFSETFIVSEILAREAAGERISIFSLRPPTDPRFHPELARVQAPVSYIDRPHKSEDLWDIFRSAQKAGISHAVAGAFNELTGTDPDDAAQALQLAIALQQRKIGHLHAHFGSIAANVARLASLLTRIPYSFTAHAADIFRETNDREHLRIKLEQAHHAITISQYNLSYLRRRFPGATDRLHLVRNGLELERFPYEEPRPVGEIVRIAAVGRLVEKKGFEYLLAAAAELMEGGFRLEVRIAGDGQLADDLQRTIDHRHLRASVRLLGAQTQDQVRSLLRSADVFVAPCVIGQDGNVDGLPTVLLEAMAIGVPCIGTDVTGIPEVIRDRHTGILVPPGNGHRLAEAILEICGPGIDRPALTRNARRLIEENYDSRQQAVELRALSMARKQAA